MWILVEWSNKREYFPSYGIIKMKYVLDKENLQYGKFVHVRDKKNKKKRRGRVLMVAESKGLVKEQKKAIRKRDAKVKAILSKCLRICQKHSHKPRKKKKVKKLERRISRPEPQLEDCLPLPQLAGCLPVPELEDCLPGPSRVCMLRTPRIPNMPTSPSSSSSNPPSPIRDSSTSSSSETTELRRKIEAKIKRKLEKFMSSPSVDDRSHSLSPHASRKSSSTIGDRNLSRHQMLRSRSMVCSTPRPSGRNKPPKIVYDMTTQTDPEPPTTLHRPTVRFFIPFIKELYRNFLILVTHIEELQARLGKYEPVPETVPQPSSSCSWSDLIHLLPDPACNSNQDIVEILKALNVDEEVLGDNSQESDENESSDGNAEDSHNNAQELDENAQNSGINAQELNETNQDSGDDTQESDENDQDSDDNDQIVDVNDQIVDVNDQIVDVNDQIADVNDQIMNVIDHIIDFDDQIAAADADMREIEENIHDPNENMQVANENVPDVAEDPQNEDDNAQMLEENVPVPVVPVPVVPVLPLPVVPVFAEPRQPSPKPRKLEVRRVSAQSTVHGEPSYLAQRCIYGDEDMIAIGYNRTLIPRRLMNDINWGSYTTATRQLLQAVFPRRVLATHSLSGKPSPAFANHPRKERLDPKIVDDIVQTVRDRCGVEKQWVRSVITTKCTDEARLYRNRQNQNNRIDQNQENQERVAGPAPRQGVPEEESPPSD